MLKEQIDKFYLEKERSSRRERTRFYITDAGKCPRAIFFKFKKAPMEEMDARVLRMFDHGDYIHRLILNTLFSLGLVRSSEINIPAQKIISGRADAVLSFKDKPGELYVLDIKSMNSFLFKGLLQPKPENVFQLQFYLHFFGIKKGILLYVNKDTQALKEFIVIYDRPMVLRLLKDLEDLKIKVDSNLIPKRIANYPKDKQCRFCQFKDICKQALAGEMSWNSFKKKISAQQSFL